MSPHPSKTLIFLLVSGMLISGVANTLLTKLQDNAGFEQPVWQTLNMFIGESGCWLVVLLGVLQTYLSKPAVAGYEAVDPADVDDEPDEVHVHGEAVLSSSITAAGEDGSDLVKTLSELGRTELRGWSLLLLALPSTCDIMGTTLVNVGLIMVPASIYQMVRGFLVVFVGLFSVVFLKRKLSLSQWGGLFLVVLGVSLVGTALRPSRLT
jgi:multidrug transporter EmrE-like cation transporter